MADDTLRVSAGRVVFIPGVRLACSNRLAERPTIFGRPVDTIMSPGMLLAAWLKNVDRPEARRICKLALGAHPDRLASIAALWMIDRIEARNALEVQGEELTHGR